MFFAWSFHYLEMRSFSCLSQPINCAKKSSINCIGSETESSAKCLKCHQIFHASFDHNWLFSMVRDITRWCFALASCSLHVVFIFVLQSIWKIIIFVVFINWKNDVNRDRRRWSFITHPWLVPSQFWMLKIDEGYLIEMQGYWCLYKLQISMHMDTTSITTITSNHRWMRSKM